MEKIISNKATSIIIKKRPVHPEGIPSARATCESVHLITVAMRKPCPACE